MYDKKIPKVHFGILIYDFKRLCYCIRFTVPTVYQAPDVKIAPVAEVPVTNWPAGKLTLIAAVAPTGTIWVVVEIFTFVTLILEHRVISNIQSFFLLQFLFHSLLTNTNTFLYSMYLHRL